MKLSGASSRGSRVLVGRAGAGEEKEVGRRAAAEQHDSAAPMMMISSFG